jgi:transcriptional regulator with XRE-family HTH domain
MPSTNTIQRLRLRRHLTQEELAARADVSVSALQAWEAGRTVPSAKSLRKLGDALSVSIDELTGDAPSPMQPSARDDQRRGAEYPGVLALLNDRRLCEGLRITDEERTLLLEGACVPLGPETADEAVQVLQAIRYMLARRRSQA